MTLRWIAGHSGAPGNEAVDVEAKRAATGESSLDEHLPDFLRNKILPRSISAIRQEFAAETQKEWKKRWEESKRYEHMHRIDPKLPSKSFLKLIKDFPKAVSSLLIQLRTGHIGLNKHLHRINKKDSPDCDECDGTPETVFHFIMECPKYNHQRHILRRTLRREANDLAYLLNNKNAIVPLVNYINSTNRLKTSFGVIYIKEKKEEK